MTGSTRSSSLAEFLAALTFLTRLPVPGQGSTTEAAWNAAIHGRAMAWYPFVGLVVGLLGAVIYRIAWGVGLPPWPAAFLTLAGLVWLTGALHEDGLADFADGAGGGATPQRRLEIMRDSRIGTYGATTLVLSLGLRVAVVAALVEPRTVLLALIAAHAASRGFMVLLAGFQGPARQDGLFASLGGPGAARAVAAGLIGASLAMTSGYRLAGVGAALLAPLAGLVAAGIVGHIAQRRLGGLTGDVLGAAQQAAEMAILLTLLTLLP